MKRFAMGLMLCGLSALLLGPTTARAIPHTYHIDSAPFDQVGSISGFFTFDPAIPAITAIDLLTTPNPPLFMGVHYDTSTISPSGTSTGIFAGRYVASLVAQGSNLLVALLLGNTPTYETISLNVVEIRGNVRQLFIQNLPETLPQPIPEPSTLGLLGLPLLGLLAAGVYGRYRQQATPMPSDRPHGDGALLTVAVTLAQRAACHRPDVS